MLVHRAEGSPDSPAILGPGHATLSFALLRERVAAVAARLREAGCGRGDHVALVLPNGLDMGIAFLGAASAAICAPLNPAYTQSEFEYYLADLHARLLVVENGAAGAAIEAAEALGIPVLRLSPEPGAAYPDVAAVDPGDIALVLHTSGSTSKPKIVPLTHRNLMVSAYNIGRTLELTSSDRSLNVMPMFHIHALVASTLASLAAGGSVVLAPGFYANEFLAWMREFRPTWYTAAPTIHQAVLARARTDRSSIARHSLRFLRVGAAPLPPKLMLELEETFRVPVIEFLGMTEAAQQIASNLLPPGKRKPGSVGVPAGPEVAIMDEAGNLLPPGATGEIVIRGANVTPGYDQNTAANESAFRQGWLRTGDEGYFDDEDYLFVTGRLKEMINRGGEKVSPREVDEALMDHPAVAQAVTFSIAHEQLGEEIGVAAVLKPGVSATELEIRQFAAERLAHFKVPRVVRFVESIPKGPTGKLRRIGLAGALGIEMIDDVKSAGRTAFVAPRSEVERELAVLWRELLGVKRVGVLDNFFALGGDSVQTTRLLSRLGPLAGENLSFVEFLESPTIASIAGKIEAAKAGSGGAGSQMVTIRPGSSDTPLFCIPGGDGLLTSFLPLSRRLDSGRPVYALPFPDMERRELPYRIEELAANNVRQMRERQPEGPYFLAGFCFGGLVALEMARQLERQGERVQLLAMIDTFNHAWMRALPWNSRIGNGFVNIGRRMRFHWRNLAGDGSLGTLYLRQRVAALCKQAWERVAQIAYEFRVGMRRPLPELLRRMIYATRYAEKLYRCQPYAGDVLLIRATHPRAGVFRAPQMGWKGLLKGRVDILEVEAEHQGLLAEPAVETVALHLDERLAREAVGR